ncbi:hypothetical protein KC19_2G176400 [Ceratodon purpureus]|uniref:Uncharacterized protein n=1 Tax=Ceratodon purpureus TaxID=3225 RepID=A0A8T0IXW2_CERPU|nr:hypothetical protein KC19_2G176400 [Ceratodon purpureus]
MAYSEAADLGDMRGASDRHQPLDGRNGLGDLDLQKRLSSMELASNGESPNQPSNLMDIIEAAESAIRTQAEENEELKSALQAAERELHARRISQQRQVAPESTHPSSRNPSRTLDFKDANSGTVPVFNHQNALTPLAGVTSSYPRQNGLSNGGGNHTANGSTLAGAHSNGSSAVHSPRSNPTSNSAFPYPRRREVEADQRNLYQGGQEVPDFNNRSGYHRSPQDLTLSIARPLEDEETNQVLTRRLRDSSLKEAQLMSEKRILERRISELRLAYDQQQQGLVDAASKALSYRQDVLEENFRLSYALQVAEQEKTVYVQNLMPLLAEYDLQPPVSDAHSVVSHVKILVQKLRSELELYENKLKNTQYYLPPRQPSYQPPSLYNPPPQSPPYQTHGLEMVPHFTERPTSPVQQPRTGRPGYESGMSSPRFAGGTREDNLHNEAPDDQEAQIDRVPHDSINSRPSESFDDFDEDVSFEGSQTPVHSKPGIGNSEAVRSPPQLPPLMEESASPSFDDNDPPPGIEGLRIVGDPVLGGRLTACGHPVNGTYLCIFQWIRHYRDGSANYIEGAAQPEYVITADDCDNVVAVECVPMDERNRRGELVKVMVNEGNWISRDPMMQDQIEAYMNNNAQPLFEVNLLEGTSEDASELATLVLRRSTYELRRNNGRKTLVNEKYSSQVSINIPAGEYPQCYITCHDKREIYLELRDSRTRDLAVLTFRAFLKAAIDEQKKKPRRKWLRG